MTDKERVKTWRVLRDGMRVGLSVRNFGDFMPEAPTLPTMRVLLNANLIEEVWVDKEEFAEWEKSQKKRDEDLAAGIDPDADLDEDEEGDEENEESEEERKPAAKKVAAKKVAAKKTAKKTVKKGKNNGEAKRLSAQRV